MKKLKWKKLLDNKCPACGEYLQHYPLERKMMCDRFGCDFMIREEGMAKMIAKLSGKVYIAKESDIFDDNLDALNNMGSDQIQDFEED